jgi:hypothetical protein
MVLEISCFLLLSPLSSLEKYYFPCDLFGRGGKELFKLYYLLSFP